MTVPQRSQPSGICVTKSHGRPLQLATEQLVVYQENESKTASGFARREKRMIQAKRMSEAPRRTSPTFAALLAILPLLLQLLLASAPFVLASSTRAEAAVALSAPDCATQDHRQAPTREGAHSHCCLLCEYSARDGLAVIGSFVVAALRADALSTPIRAAPDRQRPAPIGWTTSWSSRAPPRFS